MYLDSQSLVSGSVSPTNALNPQNVFATNASVLSTNTVDLLQQRDIGEGLPVAMHVHVGTSFAGGTSAEFQVITADDPALSVNVLVLSTSDAVPIAKLTQGTKFALELAARPRVNGQRYIGLRTVNVGANTAGAVFAWLGTGETSDPMKAPMYTTGFGVA